MDEFDEMSDAEIEALTEMDEMCKGIPNPLPQLTPEERSAASQKAIETRKARMRLKREMKEGNLSVAAAIELPVMQRMKVFEFIRAIPGIGINRAREFMLSNSIADNRRVGGLSKHRRAQVIALGGER
jgi:hypothetical protein|nr:MAG TPA: Integration host factor MIHF [Caudoviricetes sp.]